MTNRERAAPHDATFMCRALSLAEKGWGQTAPNPMVGAVVVRDGIVVGEGWHTRYGASHAEVEALRSAGDAAQGATLYVSLEPCNHHGKTPPCTEAILRAGIARVVIATADPSPRASGGSETLSSHGVKVTEAVEEQAAKELNAVFFHALSSSRPFIILKFATSMDGAIADHTRKRAWLTGVPARREVHRLRAGVDAVGIGIGTALADDPLLTVRDFEPPPRKPPARVVFDRTARLSLTSRLVSTARTNPTFIIAAQPDTANVQQLEIAGAHVLTAATLAEGLGMLCTEGVQSMLVEGGSILAASFIDAGFVDRLAIFRAPMVLGSGALPAFRGVRGTSVQSAPRWRVIRSCMLGDDEMTVYEPRH